MGKGAAISPFLTVFSKDLYCRDVKTRFFWGEKVNGLSKPMPLVPSYNFGIPVNHVSVAKHSQEQTLSFSADFVNMNVTQLPCGFASKKLCYIEMLLKIEKSGMVGE